MKHIAVVAAAVPSILYLLLCCVCAYVKMCILRKIANAINFMVVHNDMGCRENYVSTQFAVSDPLLFAKQFKTNA